MVRAQHIPAEPVKPRRTRSPAILPASVDELQMAVGQVRVDRPGEDVCRVLLAGPVEKGEVSRAHALLRPLLTNCE
eukprot:14448740-Alexandrium_andersonii.AAC.1